MATRQHRLDEFSQSDPPADTALRVLCEDTRGTYVLPFLCCYEAGRWLHAITGAVIDGAVVGWRTL